MSGRSFDQIHKSVCLLCPKALSLIHGQCTGDFTTLLESTSSPSRSSTPVLHKTWVINVQLHACTVMCMVDVAYMY